MVIPIEDLVDDFDHLRDNEYRFTLSKYVIYATHEIHVGYDRYVFHNREINGNARFLFIPQHTNITFILTRDELHWILRICINDNILVDEVNINSKDLLLSTVECYLWAAEGQVQNVPKIQTSPDITPHTHQKKEIEMRDKIEEIVSSIECNGDNKHTLTIGNHIVETMYTKRLDIECFEFHTKDINVNTHDSVPGLRVAVTFKLCLEGDFWILYSHIFGNPTQRTTVTTEEGLAAYLTDTLTPTLNPQTITPPVNTNPSTQPIYPTSDMYGSRPQTFVIPIEIFHIGSDYTARQYDQGRILWVNFEWIADTCVRGTLMMHSCMNTVSPGKCVYEWDLVTPDGPIKFTYTDRLRQDGNLLLSLVQELANHVNRPDLISVLYKLSPYILPPRK